MTEKFKEYYQTFIETWGVEKQSTVAIEEMSELTKAICKLKRKLELGENTNKTLSNLKEEIGDVLNMVEQLEFVYGIEEIEKNRQEKMERILNERILNKKK